MLKNNVINDESDKIKKILESLLEANLATETWTQIEIVLSDIDTSLLESISNNDRDKLNAITSQLKTIINYSNVPNVRRGANIQKLQKVKKESMPSNLRDLINRMISKTEMIPKEIIKNNNI